MSVCHCFLLVSFKNPLLSEVKPCSDSNPSVYSVMAKRVLYGNVSILNLKEKKMYGHMVVFIVIGSRNVRVVL